MDILMILSQIPLSSHFSLWSLKGQNSHPHVTPNSEQNHTEIVCWRSRPPSSQLSNLIHACVHSDAHTRFDASDVKSHRFSHVESKEILESKTR